MLEIQVPLNGIQYSRLQINLESPTDESITEAFQLLDRVNDLFVAYKNGDAPVHPSQDKAPGDVSIDQEILAIENKQLKSVQEKHQEFLNLLKFKDPELFTSLCSQVGLK